MVLAAMLVVIAVPAFAQQDKVAVCHQTGAADPRLKGTWAEGHPKYVELEVPENAAEAHLENENHQKPPFGDFPAEYEVDGEVLHYGCDPS